MKDNKITVAKSGIIIELTDEQLKHSFELAAGDEFEIKDFDKYKAFVAKQMREEACPHTGEDHLQMMLNPINDYAMEDDQLTKYIES